MISREWKTDTDGSKIFIFHDKDPEDFLNIREVKYSPEGKPVQCTKKENGYLTYRENFDPEPTLNPLPTKVPYPMPSIIDMPT
ncbi:MAG: hypothetical protein IJ877_00025 [Candidatus Gastranaerophilales bacterium]|nr:hypothetical protein [Candidatus Gastranaerophilales bacterium]